MVSTHLPYLLFLFFSSPPFSFISSPIDLVPRPLVGATRLIGIEIVSAIVTATTAIGTIGTETGAMTTTGAMTATGAMIVTTIVRHREEGK